MDYKEIEEALKDMKLEPYGLSDIWKFVSGNMQIKKNGNFKVTLEFPKECLKRDSIPFKLDDFDIVPLLLFAKQKENN